MMSAGSATRLVLALSLWRLAGFLPAHHRPGIAEPALPGWMAGCWLARSATDTLEEYWTVPRASTMFGIARLVHKDSLITYEQNRIEIRGGRLMFISNVEAEPSKEYTAIQLAPNQVIFDGRQNIGERIRYRRNGDTLRVRFARYRDSTESGVEEPMRLVRCEHQ